MEGKLIILSAPSGAGKTSIVKYLLLQELPVSFSISATSRPKRHNEEHCRDYYFLSVEEFKQKIEKKEFLEWEEVYPNRFYGTLRSEVERIWKTGKHVVLDLDVLGGLNVKKEYGEMALALFIKPPDLETLEQRLTLRGTEDIESLKQRIAKAEFELSYEKQFDKVIINDDLEKAQQEVLDIVRDFIHV